MDLMVPWETESEKVRASISIQEDTYFTPGHHSR